MTSFVLDPVKWVKELFVGKKKAPVKKSKAKAAKKPKVVAPKE